MPTYDYICEDCGYEFEQFQGIKAKPLRKCPECNKMSLKRLIGSGAGIIFKGSGFYQTDYRSESYQKAVKSEKDKAETKTEKTETKAKDKDTKSGKKAKAKTETKGEKKTA